MEEEQFILDMLFVSVSADDHEDVMNEILYYLTDDGDEIDFDDIMFASIFAGVYHVPTSFEQESLDEVRRELGLRYLNG